MYGLYSVISSVPDSDCTEADCVQFGVARAIVVD